MKFAGLRRGYDPLTTNYFVNFDNQPHINS
jgi:hypothetical protein